MDGGPEGFRAGIMRERWMEEWRELEQGDLGRD